MAGSDKLANSLHFSIRGMTCASCSARIEKMLRKLPGIREVRINLGNEFADVDFNPKEVSAEDIRNTVIKTGYEPEIHKEQFLVEGMTCAACVARVEKVLRRIPSVLDVAVNLADNKATVTSLGKTPRSELFAVIRKAGYEPRILKKNETGNAERSLISDRKELRHALIALILSAPLALPMLLMPFGIHWMPNGWVQMILAAFVQFWLGARFYKAGWKALKSGSGNMDLLVSMGTSAAFFFSVYQLFSSSSPQHEPQLYFEASAVVIALVLLGKYLEARAKKRTAEALQALAALHPPTASVIRNGIEQEIPSDNVVVGDIVVIRAGKKIPVDGIILEGRSEIDESLITGESLPVSRDPGQKVVTGSINGTGFIKVETTATGDQTTLAKIIQLVEGAQSSKAPIQRMVDQVAAIFVPVVLVIALITFIATWLLQGSVETALIHAVAVMVIACPCALGLATPTAIMAGTGVAARHGILIKDAETLERANAIKAVAFDKTGTLTLGKPELIEFKTLQDNGNDTDSLKIALALQKGSEHPLAHAVMQAAEQQNIETDMAEDVQTVPGRGITGMVKGVSYALGNQLYMEECGFDPVQLKEKAASFAHPEATLSFLAALSPQPYLSGIFFFADAPRPSAHKAITYLNTNGVSTVMITGDSEEAALSVARSIGIQHYRANVLPEDKVETIKKLQKDFTHVAMVGDGINDAPALAAADLGIAMGTGTDAAIAASGITLMRSDPLAVIDALDIAHQTQRKIRQNLFWAFIYNCLGIPLAAFGFLSPTLAGAAMAFSSVSVVTNALTLRRWKPVSSRIQKEKII